jgi:ubiquitin-conjugating enzyme E2 Q
VQVDDPDYPEKNRDDRLHGMEGWMQFRFAMGAPDKERRFMNSVQSTKNRLRLTHPTIFAWHGSPLMNWHSIIREGLHYRDIAHGRAFGNGCYHSLDFNTSYGYSGMYNRGSGFTPNTWPASALKVSCSLALNEIVNAPGEFTSRTPHLVVAQLDWIQTRYLFVQCHGDLKLSDSRMPEQIHPQDPQMTPSGQKGKIIIPLNAMPKSRRGELHYSKGRAKKKLKASGSSRDPIAIDLDDDDTASIDTDVEDLNILIEEEDDFVPAPTPSELTSSKGKEPSFMSGLKSLVSKASKPSKTMTDFQPGTLDYSTLTLLAQPSWSTTSATKRLQKEFQTLIKVQESQPLHELGWYTDPEQFSNVYQWIVELHSFEEHLPLAKQMKQKGIKSVVMEMRFGPDYPMSPPFVRVIRPRFLGFQVGGGGHVTAGGSICMEVSTTR